jgi:crossover junction endodeoxyribonuclease RuvC
MLKLGMSTAMAAGLSRDIPITEYEPKKIKWPSTGTETPAKNSCKMLQQL